MPRFTLRDSRCGGNRRLPLTAAAQNLESRTGAQHRPQPALAAAGVRAGSRALTSTAAADSGTDCAVFAE
jgi:hypothetical protein